IAASKAGDSDHKLTTSTVVPVLALKADQTIDFAPLADRTLGDPPLTVSATGGGSGNPVMFTTTTSEVCSSSGVDGATITILTTGSCTVRAFQAGDANYKPADDVDRSFLVQAVQGGLAFAGLFTPWAPPGPGTYNGMTFASGTAYNLKSSLPLKWGYASNGTLVDSSRPAAQYPVVNIRGPLATCAAIDGAGSDPVVPLTGPGATLTSYNPITKTCHRNLKLESPQGNKCYDITIYDPVTNTTSPPFPFKTKK